MAMEPNKQQVVLVADDSPINRAILTDMLVDEYTVIEAADGTETVEALQRRGTNIDLVLLDVIMPRMDGFDVLRMMNHCKLIQDIPVIMITAETSGSLTKHAYDLGVSDFITRPFDQQVVHRRIVNTIMLYSDKKALTKAISRQVLAREKAGDLVVTLLASAIEAQRGARRRTHIPHVKAITEALLNHLVAQTERYGLSASDISAICLASSLHDIGMAALAPELRQPSGDRQTQEHTTIGGEMIAAAGHPDQERLLGYAYQICRWHHERWDGTGYPDGLAGDQIPIAAQVVGLADAYETLTGADPCYDHATAMELILGGSAGSFNPDLLECLLMAESELKETSQGNPLDDALIGTRAAHRILEEARQHDGPQTVRAYNLLEEERAKRRFLESLVDGTLFEYNVTAKTLMLDEESANMLGLPSLIADPERNGHIASHGLADCVAAIRRATTITTPEHPQANLALPLGPNPNSKAYDADLLTIWHGNHEAARCVSIIGRVHEPPHHNDPEETRRSRTGIIDAAREAPEPSVPTAFATLTVTVDDYASYCTLYGKTAGEACLGKIGSLLSELGARHGIRFYRQGSNGFLGICLRRETSPDKLASQIADSVLALGILHAGAKHGTLVVTVKYGQLS